MQRGSDPQTYELRFIPRHLKAQEMCDEAVRITLAAFFLISDRFKTQEMCGEAVRIESCFSVGVPDRVETQKIFVM